MGMHFGVLVADMSWPDLLVRLETQTGVFIDQGIVEDLDEFDLAPEGKDFLLLAGELDGKAYLFDTSFFLSGTPDFITNIAADSGKLVIGCGAETVSGTYYLVVARGEEVLRHYYNCFTFADFAGVPSSTAKKSWGFAAKQRGPRGDRSLWKRSRQCCF
jgi:hypothetical protein